MDKKQCVLAAQDLHVNKIILFPLWLQVFIGTTNSHLHIPSPPPPSPPTYLHFSVHHVPGPGAKRAHKNDFDLTEEKLDNFFFLSPQSNSLLRYITVAVLKINCVCWCSWLHCCIILCGFILQTYSSSNIGLQWLSGKCGKTMLISHDMIKSFYLKLDLKHIRDK